MKLLLASGSPRRRDLLESVGFSLQVRPPYVDEIIERGESPRDAVLRLALLKASAVEAGDEQTILAADTVVALGPTIFGKPASEHEASQVLNRLSGVQHEVWTGWCVRRAEEVRSGAVCTRVSFRKLSASEIAAYVASGEPMDKAGAYAIQGRGGALVDRIEGSYSNVVGLPMTEVLNAIEELERL